MEKIIYILKVNVIHDHVHLPKGSVCPKEFEDILNKKDLLKKEIIKIDSVENVVEIELKKRGRPKKEV